MSEENTSWQRAGYPRIERTNPLSLLINPMPEDPAQIREELEGIFLHCTVGDGSYCPDCLGLSRDVRELLKFRLIPLVTQGQKDLALSLSTDLYRRAARLDYYDDDYPYDVFEGCESLWKRILEDCTAEERGRVLFRLRSLLENLSSLSGWQEIKLEEFLDREFTDEERLAERWERIRVLSGKKAADAHSAKKLHRYRLALASLYAELGEPQKQRGELLEDFLEDTERTEKETLAAFGQIRELCAGEEWPAFRDPMLKAVADPQLLCRLLTQEQMIQPLHELVLDRPQEHFSDFSGQVAALDLCADLLAPSFAPQVLEVCSRRVRELGERSRSPKAKEELYRRFDQMKGYPGGEEVVHFLADELIHANKRRHAFVYHLQQFL